MFNEELRTKRNITLLNLLCLKIIRVISLHRVNLDIYNDVFILSRFAEDLTI